MQVSNLPSEALIKKEAPVQVFSREFSKNFKNTLEQLRASVILTLLKYDFQSTVHFLPTFITFQLIHQTQ